MKEQQVLEALGRLPGNQGSIQEIATAVGDDSAVQSYYPVLNRLVADGKVAEVRLGGRRLFCLTSPSSQSEGREVLSPEGPWYSRDEIYYRKTNDGRAEVQAVRAAESLLNQLLSTAQRREALCRAAQALLTEDPRALCKRYVHSRVAAFKAAIRDAEDRRLSLKARRDAADRARALQREIQEVVHQGLGVHKTHLLITPPSHRNPSFEVRRYDPAAIDDRIDRVVHGEYALLRVEIPPSVQTQATQRLILAGTDASTHPVQLATPDTPHESKPLAVNNASAYFQFGAQRKRRDADLDWESLPYDLVAGLDGENVGAIVGPHVYDELLEENGSDDKFWRTVACASDTLQYTLEGMVLQGRVERPEARGTRRTPPDVVIRDGRIYPIEHLLNSYKLDDAYGEAVRREIAAFADVVKQVLGSMGTQTYYGCVKQSKIRIFSPILSWYVREGSAASSADGRPIDETWPDGDFPPDTAMVTELMSFLDSDPEAGVYYTTFGVERDFSVMAGFIEPKHVQGPDSEPITDFVAYFEQLVEEDERDYGGAGGLALFDPRPYAYLCQNASTVLFVTSLHRPVEDTTYRLPRFELLVQRQTERLEPARLLERSRWILDRIVLILSALRSRGIQLDADHDFGTGARYVLPEAIWEAHEASRAIGDDYAGRIKAAVYQKLATLLQRMNDPRQLRLLPLWLPPAG